MSQTDLDLYNLKYNHISSLSITNAYNTGSLILGYPLKVTDQQVILSLPGGVSGIVRRDEISDLLKNDENADMVR